MDIEKPKELFYSRKASESASLLFKNPEHAASVNLEIQNANFVKNDYKEEARRIL